MEASRSACRAARRSSSLCSGPALPAPTAGQVPRQAANISRFAELVHESPRPRHRDGLVLRSFLPAPHPATVPRPPKKSAAPRARAGRRAARSALPLAARPGLSVRVCLESPHVWKCSGYRLRTKAKSRRNPPAGMSRANRSTSFRRLSRLKLAPRNKSCKSSPEARRKEGASEKDLVWVGKWPRAFSFPAVKLLDAQS